MNDKLKEIIAEQQVGHENEPAYMIGCQLLDMAERSADYADILVNDLETDGMKLADAEKRFQEYADKEHKGTKCFCITPIVAEKLLSEFYGLPDTVVAASEPEPTAQSGFIDLDSFL